MGERGGIEAAATPAIAGDKSRVANATDGIRRRKGFSEASADEGGATLRKKILLIKKEKISVFSL